ncbi:hypothetical protein [Enterococcus sp. AZ109]|uniref:hypothetical protein n=1 Tax=Enterococcus sp. AZ109 TaxID=2774634 RepID=UPI003F27E22F
MKKVLENLIMLGFVLFFIGGLGMVLLQLAGLILFDATLVHRGREFFSWIFPAASITGLLCYGYSYIKEYTKK